MHKGPACAEGVYVHINRRAGQWRVGESANVPTRAQRSLIAYQDCLGNPRGVDTLVLPTCGLAKNRRREIEKKAIDILSKVSPTAKCNVRRT
jgi:hypothetical protein